PMAALIWVPRLSRSIAQKCWPARQLPSSARVDLWVVPSTRSCPLILTVQHCPRPARRTRSEDSRDRRPLKITRPITFTWILRHRRIRPLLHLLLHQLRASRRSVLRPALACP